MKHKKTQIEIVWTFSEKVWSVPMP